ncbi:hypothetical protein [Vagococcus salmoninarum]|uniref:hypothetical protein n=1 Tax=Vagococcus salmoninarum TaxID=2739 RepID=UPI003F9D48A0
MGKVFCGTCDKSISVFALRHQTKDRQFVCSSCLKAADISMASIGKYNVKDINSVSVVTTKTDIRLEKSQLKQNKKENKNLSKGKPNSYCRFTVNGVVNTPFEWKGGVGFNELTQLSAGKIMIDHEYEYDLLEFTWLPKVKGQKNFPMTKALTGAALIGAAGFVVGASGKKGEDDSEILLTLKDTGGHIFKVIGKMDSRAAENMSRFITLRESEL